MGEYIIEMKNITKKFPNIIANDNISLGIKKGEIFALLGENGAGKSTLMSILFGLYEPDEGEIFIRGKKETISSPNQATKLNIGMVHQHFKLVQNYTITENIILGMEPMKKFLGIFPIVNVKETNNVMLELSEKYGLKVEPTKKIEEVSVPIQQRVEILKMLYREAEILIFDEPTAVLTPQEIEFFLKILESLKNSGKTIILITHKLEEIKKIADRCAIMCKGKLIDILNVRDSTTKQMAHMMVGRDVSFVAEKKDAKFGKNVLEVNNISVKDIEGFVVVKNVTFNVRQGEIFAIAGVSGNGQVELVDAIAGLFKTISGEIKLNNTDITNLSVRERTELGISYIPEDRQKVGLILESNVTENIILKQYYKKDFSESGILNNEKSELYSKQLVDNYDIRTSSGISTTVRDMSGGNQQKIIIAREISLGSDLMIFVQPTRGLDIGAIENIHKRIIEQRNKNKAIILVSLELEEIMSCADTVGVIYNGQLVSISDKNDISVQELGEFMMGVNTDVK